jgi:hypothetical protein
MRPLFILTALVILTAPATAQTTTPKDNKQTATASAPSKDNKTGTPGQQTPAPPKDETITNYDVNGSNAADAMGGTR